MANLATYAADKHLNVLKGTTWTAPATTYLGLFTSAPGPGSEGTEVSGGSYARVALTSSSAWSAISGSPPTTPRQISNAAAITFPTATADWGDIVGWVLFDAASAGNRLRYGLWSPIQTITTGKVFKPLSGQLVITIQ